MKASTAPMRWYDYLLTMETDASAELVRAAAGSTTLLICGAGFDPRTLDAPRLVNDLHLTDLTVIAVRPEVNGEHSEAELAARGHETELRTMFNGINIVDVPITQDPAAAGTRLTRLLQGEHHILDFDTVIVDMSGLPSAISYPILQLCLLQSSDRAEGDKPFSGNLVVTVSEDASTDRRIVASGLGQASVLPGFSRLPEDQTTLVWVPVLGAGVGEELRAIGTMLEPHEVCPAVPFPSRDPRQGDNLLLEHRELLQGEWQFEPRNVLYASESNPFDLYRQLVRLARRYRQALRPLGEPTIVVSEHSSKTLSLGVLLAAHEEQLVVAHVRPTAYRLEASETPRDHRVAAAWLTGTPYSKSSAQDTIAS